MAGALCREQLAKAGLDLPPAGAGGAAQLRVEPAVLRATLRPAEKDARTLVDDLMALAQNPADLRMLLQPVQMAPADGGLALAASAPPPAMLDVSLDSPVRLLLGVPVLQPLLITALLEKLSEFSYGDDDDSAELAAADAATNMPRLLLGQLRWLEQVHAPMELAQKMLEMAEITPTDIQREIITCLPEVIDDRAAAYVVEELRSKLTSTPELTVPILDALANLNLPDTTLDEIRDQVLFSLKGYDPDALPVVVRFILQSVTPSCAEDVVAKMRDNLDFESLASSAGDDGDAPAGAAAKRGSTAHEVLTLDAIRAGVRFQKCLTDAWLKIISRVSSASEYKVLDLFMLLILHSIASNQKSTETFFMRRVKAGMLTCELLDKAFANHRQGLARFVKPLLTLAELLMRTKFRLCLLFAQRLYQHSFVAFDAFAKQEVVGALVTHVGSTSAPEIQNALHTLHLLVEQHPKDMAQYHVFVKGILDYVDNLEVAHVRDLFSILSILTLHAEGGLADSDELHIFIRKMPLTSHLFQLSKASLQEKRVGVIGATTVVSTLALPAHGAGALPSEQRAAQVQESQNLLKLVLDILLGHSGNGEELAPTHDMSSQAAVAVALFYDELAHTVNSSNIESTLLEWIAEEITTAFQTEFLVDVADPLGNNSFGIQPTQAFGLEEDGYEIVLSTALTILEHGAHQCHHFVAIGPLFKLLQFVEKAQNEGKLSEIDALLGCGIYHIPDDRISAIASCGQDEKDAICFHLFTLCNWFREIINAFAAQSDPEMHSKVLRRLEHLNNVYRLLAQCMVHNPNYRPPLAHFEKDLASGSNSAKGGKKGAAASQKGDKSTKGKGKSAAGGKGAAKGGGKSKAAKSGAGGKAAAASAAAAGPMVEDEGVSDDAAAAAFLEKLHSPDFHPYFREFEIDVFEVLRYELYKDMLDTNLDTMQVDPLTLRRADLALLLEDLERKLSRVLHPPRSVPWATSTNGFSSRSFGFDNVLRRTPDSIVGYMIGLLPKLLTHLEKVVHFFQEIIDENDGLSDAQLLQDKEGAAEMIVCFNLILRVLELLLSWERLSSQDGRELLVKCMKTIGQRLSSSPDMTFHNSCQHAFRYVMNLIATAPTCEIASAVIRLCELIRSFSDESQQKETFREKIAAMCKDALRQSWTNDDKRPIKALPLSHLLKTYLDLTSKPVDALKELVFEAIDSLKDPSPEGGAPKAPKAKGKGASKATNKTQVAKGFPTLTVQTFPVYFKVILANMVDLVARANVHESGIDLGKNCHMPDEEVDSAAGEQIELLNTYVELLKAHLFAIKTSRLKTKPVLMATLKTSRFLIEGFQRSCMPMLDRHFAKHADSIMAVMSKLQKSTRMLQNLCSHSKICKDVSLTSQVPALKRSLESLLFRVKAILATHNCQKAFRLGTLKNRDLDGRELPTQIEKTSSDEEGDELDLDMDMDLPENEDEEDEEEDEEEEEEDEDEDEEDSNDSRDGHRNKKARTSTKSAGAAGDMEE